MSVSVRFGQFRMGSRPVRQKRSLRNRVRNQVTWLCITCTVTNGQDRTLLLSVVEHQGDVDGQFLEPLAIGPVSIQNRVQGRDPKMRSRATETMSQCNRTSAVNRRTIEALSTNASILASFSDRI